MVVQMLVFSAVGLGFIGLGYLIKNQKCYNLIAGYNTLSQEEKARVDIKGLAILFKQVMMAMGILITGISILDYVWGPGGLTPGIAGIIMVAGTVYLLIKSRKFKKK